jgi:hypothetical protein
MEDFYVITRLDSIVCSIDEWAQLNYGPEILEDLTTQVTKFNLLPVNHEIEHAVSHFKQQVCVALRRLPITVSFLSYVNSNNFILFY